MDSKESITARKLMEAFFQFRRLHRNHSPLAGLRPSEIFVLACIKEGMASGEPGIKVSEISNMLSVTSPTVTQLLNGLESSGFIERSMDQEDRRAVRIKLTGKGETVLQKASEAFLASFSGLAAYLGEEKSNQLAALLTKAFTYLNENRKSGY